MCETGAKIIAEPSKIRSPKSFQSLFSFCRGECTDRQKARISHFASYIEVTKQIYTEQSKYDRGLFARETVRKLWAMCHKVLLSTRQGGKGLNYFFKKKEKPPKTESILEEKDQIDVNLYFKKGEIISFI